MKRTRRRKNRWRNKEEEVEKEEEKEEEKDEEEMNHEEEHDQEDAVFREADEAEKDTDEQMNDEEMNGEDNDEEEQDKYEVHEADQAENSSSPSEEAADEPFIPEFHKIAQKLFNSDQDTVENAPTQPATHIVADAPKRAEMLPPGHQSFRIKAAHGGRSAGRRGLRGSSNEEPEMKIGAVQGRDDASLRSARRDLEKEAASGVLPDKADVLAQNALMQSELDAALYNAQQAENKVTQLKAELDRSKLGRQVVSNHIGNIGQTYDAQMSHLEKEITTLKHMCEESKALKAAEKSFGKITTEVNKYRFNR